MIHKSMLHKSMIHKSMIHKSMIRYLYPSSFYKLCQLFYSKNTIPNLPCNRLKYLLGINI